MKKSVLVLLLIFFLVGSLLFFINKTPSLPGGVFIMPTPVQIQTQNALPNNYHVTNQDKIQIQEQYQVTQLINKIPYNGVNFRLGFDFNSGKFVLTLNSNNTILGNNEFDAFLRQNGIANRSWFNNLIVTYQSFTPAP